MKKLKTILGLTIASLTLLIILSAKPSQASIKPGTYWQTMRYCGWEIKLACTTVDLATPCSSYYCLVDY